MAQYKVPQDVEAEDKLLGPFTFRQFVYLMITAGCLFMAFGLFQLFPLLALIPLPFIIFFGALAIPLKRDQPMETYLAAVVNFYLKPNKRKWIPGQRESTIEITAPKKVEKPRTRNITEEEASHRLSFLADLVDTEGYSIKNTPSSVREEYIAEAQETEDILDSATNPILNQMIQQENTARHDELVNQMREAIARSEAIKNGVTFDTNQGTAQRNSTLPPVLSAASLTPTVTATQAPVIPQPSPVPAPAAAQTAQPAAAPAPQPAAVQPQVQPRPDIQALANDKDYSIETISKEAQRLKNKDEKEVFISLH